MAGIFDEKCKEKEKYREEQIGECPFSIPRHNLSLRTCIPKLKFLPYTVVQMSLTKNLETKEKKANIWKNKQEKAQFQFHDTTCRCESVY